MPFKLLEFFDIWKKNYDKDSVIDHTMLNRDFIVNKIARINNMLYLIMDYTKLEIIFFSDNVEELFGYTDEEVNKKKIKLIFDAMSVDLLMFPFKIVNWHNSIVKENGTSQLLEGFSYTYCGLSGKKKNGDKVKVLINHWPFDIQKNGYGRLGLIALQDITFLYSGKHYWGKIDFDKHPQLNKYFHSNDKLGRFDNMFSAREKDILKLINEGLTSRDISEKLFISHGTVDKHRKNIIEKSGFKDIPSLFQVFSINKLLQ